MMSLTYLTPLADSPFASQLLTQKHAEKESPLLVCKPRTCTTKSDIDRLTQVTVYRLRTSLTQLSHHTHTRGCLWVSESILTLSNDRLPRPHTIPLPHWRPSQANSRFYSFVMHRLTYMTGIYLVTTAVVCCLFFLIISITTHSLFQSYHQHSLHNHQKINQI